jgi:hypothetical protein
LGGWHRFGGGTLLAQRLCGGADHVLPVRHRLATCIRGLAFTNLFEGFLIDGITIGYGRCYTGGQNVTLL